MTIKELLKKGEEELKEKGIETAFLDVKLLLKQAVNRNETFLLSHPEYELRSKEKNNFEKMLQRRKSREPIAYILNQKEFFGLNFLVNKNVLIPRPETEWLIEKSIAFLKNYELRIKNQGLECHSEPEFSGEESSEQSERSASPRSFANAHNDKNSTQNKEINILDMGTGSGCIIISLAKELSTTNYQLPTNLYGVEIDRKAITVAKKNAKLHNVEKNIKFYFSDLFSNRFLNKRFDLIIANLPYVPHSAKNSSIAFEPKGAIFAEDNGMEIIKQFLIEAKDQLNKSGLILLETDCRNAKKIFDFAQNKYPEAKVELKKDFAGLDRYIMIKK